MSDTAETTNRNLGIRTNSNGNATAKAQDDPPEGFDADPLNSHPVHNKHRKTKSESALQIMSRPRKTRSVSPHSRFLSRRLSRGSNASNNNGEEPTIVAVTSCRSDAYYHQKAPGSASKLPQKAPSALKLFHELATGVKDAFEAVGKTPARPPVGEDGKYKASDNEVILWEFMGHLDLVSNFTFTLIYF